MAVNTGIRFEKIFDLLIPSSLTECAKKTKETEEARIAKSSMDVMISLFRGTSMADLNSNTKKRGKKRKIPIRFCQAIKVSAEYLTVSFLNVTV